MLKLIRLFILGLALVAVALVSALTAMRIAIHGREVRVPKMVGMTPLQAQNAAGALGLVVVSEDKFYSGEVPEGRIVSQSPEAGARVRSGWKVRVAESLGPLRIEVPDLVGQSARAAAINAQRRGLELADVDQAALPGATADEVVAQSPAPNATDAASPKITVLLAAPQKPKQYVMPNLAGRELADVAPLLNDAGLELGEITERSAESPGGQTFNNAPEKPVRGLIVRQTPAPGQRVEQGTKVSLEIAR